MSFDVGRFSITVNNGASASTGYKVHELFGDVVLSGITSTGIMCFSPASLNTGVFMQQIAWHDPDDPNIVWYNLAAPPAAGAVAQLNINAYGSVSFRIQATTPPNANTTFKYTKQYWATGRVYG